MAGVIPIIFAVSILLFPAQIAPYFTASDIDWVKTSRRGSAEPERPEQPSLYGTLYFLLVVFFTYFYTAFQFRPDQTADYLRKNGGFIPGIRPGKPTEEFLARVHEPDHARWGAVPGIDRRLPFIVVRCVPARRAAARRTSILIGSASWFETMKQLEAQMMMRHYEGFIRDRSGGAPNAHDRAPLSAAGRREGHPGRAPSAELGAHSPRATSSAALREGRRSARRARHGARRAGPRRHHDRHVHGRSCEARTARGADLDGSAHRGPGRGLDRRSRRGRERRARRLHRGPGRELVARVAGRWVCPTAARRTTRSAIRPRVPGAATATDAELVQRDDDRPEVVARGSSSRCRRCSRSSTLRATGRRAHVDGTQPIEAVTRRDPAPGRACTRADGHDQAPEEVDRMRHAGRSWRRPRRAAGRAAPGRHDRELDSIAERMIRDAGAVPSFLGYGSQPAVPGVICASINDEVVHGIPSPQRRIARATW
jgi:hypothetical protein